ncbi:hypothetical protein WJX75_000821 [Coccomyxa subellipsoidea]|uniref:L-dopachrome isomerase n=1 Tax=Coccomyxa subellipsoidea TaxID=248742 RepID=A0ABR2YEK0_9CHLO
MPILNITTNVPDDVITNSDTLKLLSKAVTDGVGKPEQISKLVADILETKLGIPSDRFYLTFHDMARSDVGWKGSTF